MVYIKEVNKDVYNYQTETHNTVREYSEVDFEDIFNGVSIKFSNNRDYLDYLVEDLGLAYSNIEGIEYLGLDTDDGSLYFNVNTEDKIYKNHKIKPEVFSLDIDFNIEDVVMRDNEKVETKIEEELEISQDVINELLEERK